MLRIAICDDEQQAREALYLQLEPLLQEETEQIVYEFSSGSTAVRWLKQHPGEIDLLFLDMEMPEKNGLACAQEIRACDEQLMLVFVTGYSDYVFDGYGAGAMDYLMKPVRAEKLQRVLARARNAMEKQENQSFVLKNPDGIFRFLLRDILYFYSDRRKVFLVTAQGEYPFYGKLDLVAAQLCAEKYSACPFVRIHQRYLVNARRVSFIGKSSVKTGQAELPVSRAFHASALRALAKSMLEDTPWNE